MGGVTGRRDEVGGSEGRRVWGWGWGAESTSRSGGMLSVKEAVEEEEEEVGRLAQLW